MNRRIRNFAICFIAAFMMAAVMPFQILTAFAATAKITFNDPKSGSGDRVYCDSERLPRQMETWEGRI